MGRQNRQHRRAKGRWLMSQGGPELLRMVCHIEHVNCLFWETPIFPSLDHRRFKYWKTKLWIERFLCTFKIPLYSKASLTLSLIYKGRLKDYTLFTGHHLTWLDFLFVISKTGSAQFFWGDIMLKVLLAFYSWAVTLSLAVCDHPRSCWSSGGPFQPQSLASVPLSYLQC